MAFNKVLMVLCAIIGVTAAFSVKAFNGANCAGSVIDSGTGKSSLIQGTGQCIPVDSGDSFRLTSTGYTATSSWAISYYQGVKTCSGTSFSTNGASSTSCGSLTVGSVPISFMVKSEETMCVCKQKAAPNNVSITAADITSFTTKCSGAGGQILDGATIASTSLTCNGLEDCGSGTNSCASACSSVGGGWDVTGQCIPVSTSSSSCFPATATVILGNGSTVQMQNLVVGDEVMVGNKVTSPVFMFSHKYIEASSEFTQLHTAAGSITLSHGHYLYVNGVLATAASAKVGDKLEIENGSTTVTSVSKVQATGLYNPHTMHGDIIVNGFRTSTYTDSINPVLAHSLLAPARAMYSLGYDLNKN